MLILLRYLVVSIIIGVAFVWLTQHNISIIILLNHTKITINAALACVILLLTISVAYLIYKLIKNLILAPWHFYNYRKEKHKKNYNALLVRAIGAYLSKDDIKLKQLYNKLQHNLKYKNDYFKGLEHLFLPLIVAKYYKITGQNEKICNVYANLNNSNKESQKLVGLQGLFCQAKTLSDEDSALNYAREAFKLSSGMKWANEALLSYSVMHNDWGGAQEIFKLIEKFASKDLLLNKNLYKQKAAILAAQAQAIFATNPTKAKDLIKQAYNLTKNHVGINVIYSIILIKANEAEKATMLLENWWQQNPHPDYAKIYIYGQNLSNQQQLNKALHLAELNPNNVYSALIVSEAYLKNNNKIKAQEYVEKAIEFEPLRRCYIQQLAIEHFNTPANNKIEEYIKLAKNAYDYAWVGDGALLGHWQALSPQTKTLNGVTWQRIESYNELNTDFIFTKTPLYELKYDIAEPK